MVTKSKSRAQASVNPKKLTWKSAVAFIITLVVGLLGGGVFISLTSDGEIVVQPASVELAEEQVPALIETDDGEVEVLNVPTVESVDGGEIKECPEDEECGLGAYVYVDVTSPQTIRASLEGKCVDVDGYYGSQCWDTSAAVSENMTGRRLSTCGTGSASGMMKCWEQNAGNDYDVIWDALDVQPGDIGSWGGGEHGHTGVILGHYNNGYVAVLSTNQGGKPCEGGGSSANVINMSMKNFLGAYRWKEYNKKEDPAKPTTSDNVKYTYESGDTFGQVIKDLGLETEAGLWGYGGDVEFYTKQLIEQDMLDENGNVKIGIEFVLTERVYI